MLNKAQQIRNGLLYFIPTIIGNVIPLLTLPIFTRILTKEDYGALALAQVYATFMSGLANFGMMVGYQRNFFEYNHDRKEAELLFSTLAFVISTFVICIIITYVFKNSFSKWIIGSENHGELLFWAFCATGLLNINGYFFAYFKNKENAKPLVSFTVGDSILTLVASLFLVVYMNVGVIGIVWGQFFARFLIFSILCTKFVKLLPLNLNMSILKDSLKISFPLTPSIFFKIVGNQFDKYMIGLLGTMGGVGIYSIGQKIANIVFSYMTTIENVFLPQVYTRMFNHGDDGGESIGRYLTPFAYISIFIAILLSLFAEEVIFLLTPKPYHGATDIVIILSMLYGSYFLGKQPQLIFAKKTFIASLLTLLQILFNVAFNIPFILKWGAIGAAWGTLLAGLISGTIFYFVSQHYYEIKWEYKKMGAIFFVFFASATLMILMRHFMINYQIRLVIKIIFLSYYIWLGIKIRVITTENFNLVRNILSFKGAVLFQRN
jgi:O-antigen/teichoic acid export membrane protein